MHVLSLSLGIAQPVGHMTSKKGPSMQHLHHTKAKLVFERNAMSCICCTLWAHAYFHLHLLTADNIPGKITPGSTTEMDTTTASKPGKLNLSMYPSTCSFSFSSSEGLLDMTPNNLPSQSEHCQGFAANASLRHQSIYMELSECNWVICK